VSTNLRSRTLTDRQVEVLTDAMHGFSARESADHLGLSVETVRVHRETLRRRLGARSMPQAVAIWKDRLHAASLAEGGVMQANVAHETRLIRLTPLPPERSEA
jgi:DNA-binding NarL/FixJ family response regulator